MQAIKEMLLFIQCAVYCYLFTFLILLAQYKEHINIIISYPPKIRQRVEEVPQHKGMIKQRKKLMQSKKIFGLIFFVVNIYGLIVLDCGFSVIVRS